MTAVIDGQLAVVTARQYAAATGIQNAAVAAAVALWLSQAGERDADRGYAAIASRLLVLLLLGQRGSAALAEAYVRDVFAAQGVRVAPDAELVLDNFAGFASDGRTMAELLVSTRVVVKDSLTRGEDFETAWSRGAASLARIVGTQLADAGRDAESVAIVVLDPEREELIPDYVPTTGQMAKLRREMVRNLKQGTYGYIRVLTPPSCGRCAILAGKWYPWSEGFARHPLCDCRHLACKSEVAEQGLITDPMEYFESLSFEDQGKLFGVANSKAILDGADIFQVVNATGSRSGVYESGGKKYTQAGRGKGSEPRITPETIYKDAGEDRILALSLLERYGYIQS